MPPTTPGNQPPPGPNDPNQSPPSAPSEGASSPASGRDSGGNAFVSDPGPGFDPAGQPEPALEADLHALPGMVAQWEKETVATILVAKGEVIHTFAGIADNDFRYTEEDLRAIAPPLVNILNRYLPELAGAQDPIALAVGLSSYLIRSGRERAQVKALLAAEEEQQPQPITGAPAPAPVTPAPSQQEMPPYPPPAPAPAAQPQAYAPVPQPAAPQASAAAPMNQPVDPTQVDWSTGGAAQ